MAEVIKGTAVCWSVGAIVCSAGISGSHFTQSTRVQRTSEKANVKDNGGTIKSQIFHGFMKTLSLTVIPSGDKTGGSADTHMPQAGTLVTITDDTGTIIDDNYNLISATENRTVDGVRTIDLELEAGDEGVELATAPV